MPRTLGGAIVWDGKLFVSVSAIHDDAATFGRGLGAIAWDSAGNIVVKTTPLPLGIYEPGVEYLGFHSTVAIRENDYLVVYRVNAPTRYEIRMARFSLAPR